MGETKAGASPQRSLLWLVGGLYFSQGLPMGLAMEALPVVMRQNGVPLDVLAFVPLAALPWILKIVWAPLVDNRWSARLGRRRTWILSMQALLFLSFVAVALIPATPANAVLLMVLMGIGMTASATQDTATDGLAAEQLRAGALGHANALQIAGMMAGFMVGGGGSLLLIDTIGQRGVMLLMSLVPLATVIAAWLWREPQALAVVPTERARIVDSFRRTGVLPLLLLAFLYGGAHAGGTSVTKLFLVDRGWSNADAGTVAIFGGLVLIAIGSPLGSRLSRHGLFTGVTVGVGVLVLGFAAWAMLALDVLSVTWTTVGLAMLLLNAGSGIVAVTAATSIMAFGGAGKQAGTDITLLQSVNVTGEMLLASVVVWLASQAGYGAMFALVACGSIGIVVVAQVVRRALPSSVLAIFEKATSHG